MSENRNRDFSKYDDMTTEELEEILRLDASAPEGEKSDTELLLYVMGVLADRRKNTNITGKTAFEAWESFQQNYLPEAEENPEDIQEHTSTRTGALWLRRLIAVAAVIALIICIPVTAKALEWEDIWEIFARWAKETFSFVTDDSSDISEPDAEYDGEYSSLQDVLNANKRDASIIPTWVPERFGLKNVEKVLSPIKEIYLAYYVNKSETLSIRVQNYLSTEVQNIEVEDDFSEIYTVSEIDYYIFENDQQIRAVWITGSYECIISGDVSLEEIKMMIESIGKG